MPETLLTVDEAAQRLKMKPATLRNQLRAGRIASVRTGKLWRIPESALEPTPPRRDVAPMVPNASNEEPRGNVAALFAPPTSDEIARQLAALDKLTSAAPTGADTEVDLSGERGEIYGYSERENRQS